MTYPDPIVQQFITDHFIPLRLLLNHEADRVRFREGRVIWTPTITFMDRRGAEHYRSPGFLPPPLFAQMLQIGLARAQLSWGRYAEAATHLEAAATAIGSPLAPEALYWLGAARYLQTHQRAPMMQAWNRLRVDYPSSIWAARVPPNQDDEPDP